MLRPLLPMLVGQLGSWKGGSFEMFSKKNSTQNNVLRQVSSTYNISLVICIDILSKDTQ